MSHSILVVDVRLAACFCVMYPKVAHGSEGEGSWWWQQSRLSLAFSCLWHSLLKDPVRRDYCEDASSRSFFVCFFGGLSVSFGVSLLHTYWSAHMGHSLCLGCNFCIFFFDSSQKKCLLWFSLLFFSLVCNFIVIMHILIFLHLIFPEKKCSVCHRNSPFSSSLLQHN